ncbi:MAG: SH3 domain-containing protein [Defluviitaleaceae bacterium]|nr:SH3 domain-containing protein [Defluviitaleaceae bacterium]
MGKEALKSVSVWILAAVFMMSMFATDASATSGFNSQRFYIFVDGLPFEVWGYAGDGVNLFSVSLRDVAYILNGTPAQFDIIEAPYGWDFWIRWGEPYTVNFTELQWISPRNALFGSYGFIPAPGGSHPDFGRNPFRRIVLGIDGDETPAITISFTAVADVDGLYFCLYDLSYWLGFRVEQDMRQRIDISTTPPTAFTPGQFIRRDTFSVGTRQVIDYAHVLRVRTGPGDNYDVLTFVHYGDEFEILDYSGRFVQIYTNRGVGWVFAGFLSRGLTFERLAARCDAEIITVLQHISGNWVDKAFHYSPVIDANSILPVNFHVHPTIHLHADDIWIMGGIFRSLPVTPLNLLMGGFGVATKPVSMYELESGIFELRYDLTRPIMWDDHGRQWSGAWSEPDREIFGNRRIVVDTQNLPIQTIRYYIGEMGRDLIFLGENLDRSHYVVEPSPGGIRLAWRLPNMDIWAEGGTMSLYRSIVRGERGERLWTIGVWSDDHRMFEHIDTDISNERMYFYSLWLQDYREQSVMFGGEWQMTVSLPLD